MIRPIQIPALILVLMAIVGWLRLHIDHDLLAIFPPENEKVVALKKVKNEFEKGGRLHLQLSVEGAKTGLSERAQQLATHLEKSEHVSFVIYRPIWEEEKAELVELLAYLWINAPPEQAQDLAARLAPDRLQSTIDQSQESLALTLDPGEIAKLARDPIGFLSHPALPQGEQENRFLSKDEKTHLLIVYPKGDLSSGKWCGHIEADLETWLQRNSDASVSHVGGPSFAKEIAENVQQDVIVAIILSSIFSGIIFWLLTKNHRLIHLQVLIVLLILTTTFGIGSLILGSLSLMSAGFASILIGLSVDYGMIICHEAKHANHSAQAILNSARKPIVFASLSTAAVFASLCLSSLPGIQELGFLVAVGILIAAYALLSFYLPLAAKYTPPLVEKKKHHKASKPMPKNMKLALLIGMVLVCLFGAMGGLPKVSFDLQVMSAQQSEAKRNLEKLKTNYPEKFNTGMQDLVIASTSPEEMLERLKKIESLVPQEALPYSSLYPQPTFQADSKHALRPVLQDWREILHTIEKSGYKNEALQFNHHLLNKLKEFSHEQTTSYPSSPTVRKWLDPTIRFDDDAYGEVLVQIPEHFQHPQATSWEALEEAITEQLPHDLAKVLIVVSILTLAMLIFAIRKLHHVLIGFLCLLTPLAIIVLTVHYSPLQWNFLNIFAIPLLLGMGVDYVIHIILAHQRNTEKNAHLLAGIQKTLLACGSTTVVGFLALTASSNEAFISLGLLCGGGIILTMLSCLVILPKFIR